MKLKTPEADDKSEIAGRMYEASDLRMAIEGGHLKTLDDVLAWVKEAESDLQALMELPVWVITENACVDIKASIAHNQDIPLRIEELKKLEGRQVAMLSKAERDVLQFFIEQGRRYNVAVQIQSDADPVELSAASKQQAESILERANSHVRLHFS